MTARTARTRALVLTNVVSYEAVAYRVIVTNVEGAVTSEVARLTVVVAPGIALQPKDRIVTEGATVSLGISLSGTAPFSYQWRWEGADLPDATNASLTFSHAGLTNAGAYSVSVSNLAGAVTSRLAQLSVAEGRVFHRHARNPASLSPLPPAQVRRRHQIPAGPVLARLR